MPADKVIGENVSVHPQNDPEIIIGFIMDEDYVRVLNLSVINAFISLEPTENCCYYN